MSAGDRDISDHCTDFRIDAPDSEEVTLELGARTAPDGGAPDLSDRAFEERFGIVGELGTGGMGVVLDGRDHEVRRAVAIKMLRSDFGTDDRMVVKFLEEAQIQGQLEHPGICPVHEIGTDAAGRLYFAMKKVRGRSFGDTVREERRRGAASYGDVLPRIIRMLVSVCDAVAFAHSRGVIHRDLKPANVMIGEFGEVLVMDWGLARLKGEADADAPVSTVRADDDSFKSMDGSVVGTPAYMPPEQARGEVDRVDERSDVYAVGAMLYFALTSTAPYGGTRSRETLDRVIAGNLEAPSSRAGAFDVPRELEAAAIKALAPDPDQRYGSMTELRDDLLAWLDGRPLAAVDYRFWQRAGKWIRRHRAAVAATLVALVVAGGAFAAAEWRNRAEAVRELEGRERAFRAETGRLQAAAIAAVGRADALAGDGAASLIEPNGEPAKAAVDAWYRAHADALDAIDRVLAAAGRAPSEATRRGVDRAAALAHQARLVERAAKQAATLGDHNYARAWLGRGATAIAPDRLQEVRDEIAELRAAHERAGVEAVRDILGKARDPLRQSREFFELALVDILRRESPAVVRALLDPAALDDERLEVRLLVIEALGRCGDVATKGPEGHDAVEALVARLAKIDLAASADEAVAIGRALGLLRDCRAHDVLHARRKEVGQEHFFSRRTLNAYALIPVPERYRDGGSEEPRTAADFVGRGIRRFNRGDLEGALADYTMAIRLDPDNDDGWVNRGVVHITRGDAEQAERDYAQATVVAPANPNAWYNLGNARFGLRRYDAALEAYEKSIELDAEYAVAWNGRARVHEVRGDFPAAIEAYTRCIELDPESSNGYNNRGIVHYKSGQYDLALADYAKAIEMAPKRTRAWVNRGLVYDKMGRLDEAIADFTEGLKNDAKDVFAYNNRGLAYKKKADYGRAIDDFTTALRVDGRNATAAYNRGTTKEAMKNAQGAHDDYVLATGLDPDHVWAWRARGKAAFNLGKTDDGLKSLGRAIALAPEDLAGWDARGRAYYMMGRFEDAVDDLEQALELHPNASDTRLVLALAFQKLGDVDDAVGEYDTLLEQDAKNTVARARRGLLRLEARSWTPAIEDFEVCHGIEPAVPHHAYHLARAYAARGGEGDLDKVLTALEAAVGAGWDASTLVRDEAFAKLRELPRFKKLLP